MSAPHLNYTERDLDEPRCPRCEVPESWCRCLPIVVCPMCGEEHEDVTGFGVLFCDVCKYCVHASTTKGICDACGRRSRAA